MEEEEVLKYQPLEAHYKFEVYATVVSVTDSFFFFLLATEILIPHCQYPITKLEINSQLFTATMSQFNFTIFAACIYSKQLTEKEIILEDHEQAIDNKINKYVSLRTLNLLRWNDVPRREFFLSQNCKYSLSLKYV